MAELIDGAKEIVERLKDLTVGEQLMVGLSEFFHAQGIIRFISVILEREGLIPDMDVYKDYYGFKYDFAKDVSAPDFTLTTDRGEKDLVLTITRLQRRETA